VRVSARFVVATVALSAALLVPPGAAWASSVGPLVLTGQQTIQTEGANIQSYAITGGTNRQPQAFVVSKPVDSSSPALLKAAVAGTHFQQAAMVMSFGAVTQSVCLRDVLVSSVKAGQGGGVTPTESVALSFNQIGYDKEGTAACSKLGSPPQATVTTSLHGGTLSALVACLAKRCTGLVSLQLPAGVCPRSAAIMPPELACAGKPVAVGRIALAAGHTRTLKLTVPRGRLRTALTRIGKGTTRGIIAVLRSGAAGKPPGPPSRLKVFNGGRPVALPNGLPAVQSVPVATVVPAPAPTTTPPTAGGGPTAPAATTLAITTCGPIDAFPRQFAGSVTPVVGGLAITMTYTPPAGAMIQQTVTTTAAGTFTDSVAATMPGTWSAQASFGGTPAYAASTSAVCQFQGG
jgi:type VI protein secretion system component Hcp